MADVIKLTDNNFETEIKDGVVLVDFFAVWCGPCRQLTAIIDRLAQHFQNKMKIAKLDIDAEPQSAAQFQVTSIPTVILFKNGQEVKRIVGLRDFDTLKDLISSVL